MKGTAMIDTLMVSGMMNVFLIGGTMLLGASISLIAESRIGLIFTIAIGSALLF